jgi:hypothetical protein
MASGFDIMVSFILNSSCFFRPAACHAIVHGHKAPVRGDLSAHDQSAPAQFGLLLEAGQELAIIECLFQL